MNVPEWDSFSRSDVDLVLGRSCSSILQRVLQGPVGAWSDVREILAQRVAVVLEIVNVCIGRFRTNMRNRLGPAFSGRFFRN